MKQLPSLPKRALLLYSLSALIPMGLMIACLGLLDITPFGNNTLVFVDAQGQYLSFLSYLRSIFSGENDLLYTFSKALGGDMISLGAYYLFSPFHLLFACFSTEGLPTAFTLVVVLKLAACGLSYYHASSRLYGHGPVHLIFSTAYALMAYNTVYCWNIMWLDGVMILPLMSLGLTELWRNGKWKLYAFSIAYSLITNFYIGYMLCIASVLFCLVLMGLKQCSFREKGIAFGKYAAASCIGGFAGAVVWLPAFLSLLGGRAGEASQALDFSHAYGFAGFPAKFVSGTLSWYEVVAGQPHVFCGTAVLLLVGIFFLHRNTPGRAKLAAAAVLLVFLASFRIEALDVAWHGFSPNRSFNYRYSFLFSFVLIRIAQHTLLEKKFSWKSLLPAAFAVGLLYLFVWRRGLAAEPAGILANMLTLAACTLVLLLRHKKENLRTVLILCCVMELGTALYLDWSFMTQGLNHVLMQDYVRQVQTMEPAISYIHERDDGFYRMEQSISSAQNDPMLFGYHGLSHFSSADKPEVMTFLEKMGFRNRWGIWSYYHQGSTADVDALLGVRYLMSSQDLAAVKGYQKIGQVNGIDIYENPNALSIATLSDVALRQVNMDQEDYFAIHNAIWSGILGKDTSILSKETASGMTLVNLRQTDSDGGFTRYEKIDADAPASVRWELTISREMPLYAYFTAGEDDQNVLIRVNGADQGGYFNANRWDMFHLGTYPVGESLVVEMTLTQNTLNLGDGCFYYEDTSALSKTVETLRPAFVTVNRSGSQLDASFTASEEKLLLFTIPYDPGWQVTLDGQRLSAENVLDCLLAVPVSPGTHTIHLRYIPQGMLPGGALSLAALLSAALWALQETKKHRSK